MTRKPRTAAAPKRPTTQTAFDLEVDREFRRNYSTTWADLNGDPEPLRRAFREGQSPAAFVRWYAEKYDLFEAESDLDGGWGGW